jgi:hypothetical protein
VQTFSERDSSNLSHNFLKLLGIISHTKQVLMSKVRLSTIDEMLIKENFFVSIASIHKNDKQIVVLIVICDKMNIEIN